MARVRDNREKAAVRARKLIQVARIALDNDFDSDHVGTPAARADNAEQWATEAAKEMEYFVTYVKMEARKLRAESTRKD